MHCRVMENSREAQQRSIAGGHNGPRVVPNQRTGSLQDFEDVLVAMVGEFGKKGGSAGTKPGLKFGVRNQNRTVELTVSLEEILDLRRKIHLWGVKRILCEPFNLIIGMVRQWHPDRHVR